MKPSSAKQKGRALQDWTTKLIRKLTGLDSDQKYTHDGDIQSRSMGAGGTDVVLSPAAKKLVPFDIECKNCESWHIDKWMGQAEQNSIKGRIPIIVAKKNRKKALVIIDAKEFFSLTINKR